MPTTATAPKKSSTATRSQSKSGNASAKTSDTMLVEFFIDGIRDIYWAEKHLTKLLPKMKKAATSEELQDAFEDHLNVTKEQVSRLEQVFELLGRAPRAKKCEAMEGLGKEGESIIEETEEGTATRDVALIMAAQKVEHYEIATYGGLAQVANTLGYTEVAQLLEATLKEEKDTDSLLTQIAENNVNYEAAGEEE